MSLVSRRIPEVENCDPQRLPVDELLRASEPRILRGLIKDWPLTRAGLLGDQQAIDYLVSFYNGKTLGFSVGGPEIRGRLFYNEDFTELNFASERGRLDQLLERIKSHANDDRPPTIYLGSTITDTCLPGFKEQNALGFSAHGIDPPPAIWIGNHTIASCHYDAPNNIACCAVGRRRFTVFPPEQIFNLYPGPFEPSPGGQAISLVDFANPDFDRYPRFRDALAAAQYAEVGPGDAVFIPSMWWHHVEGLSAFNALVNYWWSSMPPYVPTPMHALFHAIWSLRGRPDNERRAWQEVFDYYVFADRELAEGHLPPQARGILSPMGEDQARQIRAMLIAKLNR